MKTPLALPFVCWALVALGSPVVAAETARPDADGFVPMFNGRDLSGWANINCAPETWSVRDGKIYCTGKPVGGLRTVKQYENFIVELEWRHLQRSGNSGFFAWGSAINAPGVPFLRGIEVQMLDHGYAEDFEKKTGKKSRSSAGCISSTSARKKMKSLARWLRAKTFLLLRSYSRPTGSCSI